MMRRAFNFPSISVTLWRPYGVAITKNVMRNYVVESDDKLADIRAKIALDQKKLFALVSKSQKISRDEFNELKSVIRGPSDLDVCIALLKSTAHKDSFELLRLFKNIKESRHEDGQWSDLHNQAIMKGLDLKNIQTFNDGQLEFFVEHPDLISVAKSLRNLFQHSRRINTIYNYLAEQNITPAEIIAIMTYIPLPPVVPFSLLDENHVYINAIRSVYVHHVLGSMPWREKTCKALGLPKNTLSGEFYWIDSELKMKALVKMVRVDKKELKAAAELLKFDGRISPFDFKDFDEILKSIIAGANYHQAIKMTSFQHRLYQICIANNVHVGIEEVLSYQGSYYRNELSVIELLVKDGYSLSQISMMLESKPIIRDPTYLPVEERKDYERCFRSHPLWRRCYSVHLGDYEALKKQYPVETKSTINLVDRF